LTKDQKGILRILKIFRPFSSKKIVAPMQITSKRSAFLIM